MSAGGNGHRVSGILPLPCLFHSTGFDQPPTLYANDCQVREDFLDQSICWCNVGMVKQMLCRTARANHFPFLV